MSKNVLRDGFFSPKPHQTMEDFVKGIHGWFPWKQKSVACVILTRDEKFILLCTPRKIEGQQDVYVQVPVQGRLQNHSENPLVEASRILRDKIGFVLSSEKMTYLGCGFSKQYPDGNDFGKCIHFVGGMFGEKAGHRTTPYASLIDWLPVTDLPIYGDQLMSKRKLWLLQQAIFAAPDKHKLFRGRMLQDALTSELISS